MKQGISNIEWLLMNATAYSGFIYSGIMAGLAIALYVRSKTPGSGALMFGFGGSALGRTFYETTKLLGQDPPTIVHTILDVVYLATLLLIVIGFGRLCVYIIRLPAPSNQRPLSATHEARARI